MFSKISFLYLSFYLDYLNLVSGIPFVMMSDIDTSWQNNSNFTLVLVMLMRSNKS